MPPDEEDLLVLRCPVRYRLAVGDVTEAQGAAEGRLLQETFEVWPTSGEPLSVSFREIAQIVEGDYRFSVIQRDGQTIEFSEIGYQYEDFLENLVRLRNELRLKDMLMDESAIVRGIPGRFRECGDSTPGRSGDCLVRLYETALVVIPRTSDPVRIPYSLISQVSDPDYALQVDTESGQSYVFSQMGEGLDLLKRTLSKALGDLAAKAQSICREILPNVPAKTLWALAQLMREGKAARRRDISTLSKDFWSQLEKRLASAGLQDSYDYFASLSMEDEMCIGFKRGLMPSREDDYVWFLAPIPGDMERGGNVLAMEATSGEGSGRATYFFRVMSRGEFALAGKERFRDEAGRVIEIVNRGMIDINFRREPIYLPHNRLLEPKYARYLSALDLLPSLRVLRSLFMGRVVHVSPEQWKKDVGDLLAFNVRAGGDNQKWKRSKADVLDESDESEQEG